MEQELFSSENVYVSNARFVVFGQTYAMSGITSVRAEEIAPSRTVPILLVIAGLFCILLGSMWPIVGMGLIVYAIFFANKQPYLYCIFLSTASGEVKALRSESLEFTSNVVQALNDSIVARG